MAGVNFPGRFETMIESIEYFCEYRYNFAMNFNIG